MNPFRRGLVVLLLGLGVPAGAVTLHVSPDGSGDYLTIQAAVNAAGDGDVILLASGVFQGDGNRDISMYLKNVTITSEPGNPMQAVIDCQGSHADPHRAFVIFGGQPVIESISMINGDPGEGNGGGGAVIANYNYDGATFANCVFARNSSGGGGAIAMGDGVMTLVSCTFYANESTFDVGGGALYVGDWGYVTLSNCIIAFGAGGGAICSSGELVQLTCCDVFGNVDGDYVWSIADQLGQNGNISEDPLFCDPASLDLQLHSDSPCAPGGDCGLIGAQPVGCGSTPVETDTWGAIKALYRSE
jgi:predicted outer membrane repeat protein